MKQINREQLLIDLKQFSINGAGLVVGKPGVGKSYLLNQLTDLLLSEQIVTLLIPINDLYDGSDKTISLALNLPDHNWVDILSQIDVINDVKGILIFDAYDAARNEIFRNDILTQIKKAKATLAGKWNVIVSVRTYDATKSEELIRLFPEGDITHPISCRKFIIPNLSDKEIEQLKDTDTALFDFYEDSSPPLQEILHVPFFLYLADAIVKHSNNEEKVSFMKFESETQLLNVFWHKKILANPAYGTRESILTDLSAMMVQKIRLNIPKSDIVKGRATVNSEALEYLCGENILNQVHIGAAKITFSHNIFFDYAVSRYTIPPEPTDFIAFILADKSRPFFLRPSYVYFFTQLWYDQRQQFWKFYFSLFDRQESVIQLFHRIVLSSVIAACFSKVDDLDDIFSPVNSAQYAAIIKNVLQSVRFIRDKTSERDLALLSKIVEKLPAESVPDYNFILNKILEDFGMAGKDISKIGEIGRFLLSQALTLQSSVDSHVYRWLGPFSVEYVCRTYFTDQSASQQALLKLFELLKEKDFNITLFQSLCEYIKEVIPFDITFVTRVYLNIFTHFERSQDQTVIGSASVVMNFTSNRQQDFELCYFRLAELFPDVLSAEPLAGIEIGLGVANFLIVVENSLHQKYKAKIKFQLHGQDCTYCEDHSFVRVGNHDHDYSNRLVNSIYDYLKKVKGDTEKIIFLLANVAKYSEVGFCWSSLIKFGIANIETLHFHFYEFCLTEVLLMSPDTLYEMAELIKVITPMLSSFQVKEIEDFIHKCAEYKVEKYKEEFLT